MVLPMASLMSLFLLLSSLSVQAVSLQGRLRGETDLRLVELEDRLGSAAQRLVARLQLRHPCLLTLPLERWATAACASAADLEPLLEGEVLGARWQLLRWQPSGSSGAAAGSAAAVSFAIGALPDATTTGPHAAFELRLSGPSPWRVRDLRPLGLRGEAS
jgi:hypothetical protein